MTKEEFIAKRGIEAWEHHLAVSREWNKTHKEQHSKATKECKKKKPEHYKALQKEQNIKFAEYKLNWKRAHKEEAKIKYREKHPIIKKRPMTLWRKFEKYCCEPIQNIENFDIALKENFKGWCIHHRLEIHPDGSLRYTYKSLRSLGIYFNRPANELIFMRSDEHTRLHHLNHKHGSKFIDTNQITVNYTENKKEYSKQYYQLRCGELHV